MFPRRLSNTARAGERQGALIHSYLCLGGPPPLQGQKGSAGGGGAGRASESLGLFFLILQWSRSSPSPWEPAESEPVDTPYPFISSPTCQWLLPRALSPPHAGTLPGAGFLSPPPSPPPPLPQAGGRGRQDDGQAIASIRLTFLAPPASPSTLSKSPYFPENLCSPNRPHPSTFGLKTWLCC